jgi:hypothetical protein
LEAEKVYSEEKYYISGNNVAGIYRAREQPFRD